MIDREQDAAGNSPVPVVRLIISDASDRVLILRRSNTEYAPGKWCLPGGKVEYGQTIDEAIKSELKDETGLELKLSEFFFLQDGLPIELGAMHCINLYFKCDVTGDVLLNQESYNYAWVGHSDLKDYTVVFGNDGAIMRFWECSS